MGELVSFKRYYPSDEERKIDKVPAYWFMVKPRHHLHKAHVKSGQTVQVKAALKRIEAEILKVKKGKMAC